LTSSGRRRLLTAGKRSPPREPATGKDVGGHSWCSRRTPFTGTFYTIRNLKALYTYVIAVRANPAAPGATIAKVTTKTK
jgi:hypothetical protein